MGKEQEKKKKKGGGGGGERGGMGCGRRVSDVYSTRGSSRVCEQGVGSIELTSHGGVVELFVCWLVA